MAGTGKTTLLRKIDDLIASGNIYKLVVESAQDFAIIVMDLEGTIRLWNSGAARIIGFTDTEIIGKDISVIFTPEDRDQSIPLKEIEKALQEGRANDQRWHLRKDGTKFFAQGSMMSIFDSVENICGFMKILTDQSERYQLRRALLDLEQKYPDMQKEFAALQQKYFVKNP